jgi:hypothetical protein
LADFFGAGRAACATGFFDDRAAAATVRAVDAAGFPADFAALGAGGGPARRVRGRLTPVRGGASLAIGLRTAFLGRAAGLVLPGLAAPPFDLLSAAGFACCFARFERAPAGALAGFFPEDLVCLPAMLLLFWAPALRRPPTLGREAANCEL